MNKDNLNTEEQTKNSSKWTKNEIIFLIIMIGLLLIIMSIGILKANKPSMQNIEYKKFLEFDYKPNINTQIICKDGYYVVRAYGKINGEKVVKEHLYINDDYGIEYIKCGELNETNTTKSKKETECN